MIDIIVTLVLLLIMLPVFLAVSIAIKLDSKGSSIFRQTRLKKDGEMFTMYKFRTMIENAERIGTGLFNYENDFRVTKVGKLLRKSSLDEIPQLINILKGDMSIVGPRPPVSYELGNYENLNEEYKKRFSVLPGITGLAQIRGRNELTWDEKIKYDNEYIDLFKKYGILIDFKIIFLTISRVFRMKDIYEKKAESLLITSNEESVETVTQEILS